MTRVWRWVLFSKRHLYVAGAAVFFGLLMLSTVSQVAASMIHGDDQPIATHRGAAGPVLVPDVEKDLGATGSSAAETSPPQPNIAATLEDRTLGFIRAYRDTRPGEEWRTQAYLAPALWDNPPTLKLPDVPVAEITVDAGNSLAARSNVTFRDGSVLAIDLGWDGGDWFVTRVMRARAGK